MAITELTKVLDEYIDHVQDAVDDAGAKIGKEAVSELKGSSPKHTGKYARGWALKKDKATHTFTVYNRTYGSLTHLLERGHVTVNGGRVAARPHIKPVEEKASEEFIQETTRLIER